MSTSDSIPTERVSAPVLMAELLALWQREKLPNPVKLETTDANNYATVELATHADFDRWAKAVDAVGIKNRTYEEFGKVIRGGHHPSWRPGWFLNVQASEPIGIHTELPAETLTALEHIADAAS